LRRLSIAKDDISKILKLKSVTAIASRLKAGNHVRLSYDNNRNLQRLTLPLTFEKTLVIERDGDDFQVKKHIEELKTQTRFAIGTIHQSLYQAASDARLPHKLASKLMRIFAWDIDFSRDLRPGDRFVVLYQDWYKGNKLVRHGDILAAKLFVRNKAHQAIRYNIGKKYSYFSPDGRSLKKSFLRAPLKFTRISSRFNLHRRHPVLHTLRAHRGVDYAAPRGTPIKATANGKVIFRGRKGGYGKVVFLKHWGKYTTVYAHMSRFPRRMRIGDKIKQGQVIGYVGSTGLASGPHVHYEFRVNNHHVDPLKVKLPRAQPIPRKYRAKFNIVANERLGQLNLYETAHVGLEER